MKDYLIKLLGGYTQKEHNECIKSGYDSGTDLFTEGRKEGLISAQATIRRERDKALKEKKYSGGLQNALVSVTADVLYIEEAM